MNTKASLHGELTAIGCIGDWHASTPAEFFLATLDAIEWALAWNASGISGTYMAVTVWVIAGGERCELMRIPLIDAQWNLLAEELERRIAAAYYVANSLAIQSENAA